MHDADLAGEDDRLVDVVSDEEPRRRSCEDAPQPALHGGSGYGHRARRMARPSGDLRLIREYPRDLDASLDAAGKLGGTLAPSPPRPTRSRERRASARARHVRCRAVR